MVVVINGYEWLILLVDMYDPRLIMPNGYTIGVTDRSNLTICIADNLDDDLMYRCLKHELCHAYIFSYGIEMSIPDEECVCQIMEVYGQEVTELANMVYCQL